MFTFSPRSSKGRSIVVAALATAALFVGACGAGDDAGDAASPAPAGSAASEPRAPESGHEPIAASMPTEISLPGLGIVEPVVQELCPMTDRGPDPLHMMDVCFYTADDKPYVLPSTDQEDVAVMAGHAGARVPGVFDDVFDSVAGEFAVKPGDELRVRTVESGDTWLVYEATDFHSPTKEELAVDDEVWGEEPTPGRLLLLTCLQPADFDQPALHNAVVGYQFVGVADDDGVRA